MKKYTCGKCSRSLASPQSSWNHKQRCKVTQASTDAVNTSKSDDSHERLDDSGSSGDYNCELCVKTFTRRADLRRHVKQVHDKEKRYQCGIWEMEFAQKTPKEEHLKTCSYKASSGKIEFTPIRVSSAFRGVFADWRVDIPADYDSVSPYSLLRVDINAFRGPILKHNADHTKRLKFTVCSLRTS